MRARPRCLRCSKNSVDPLLACSIEQAIADPFACCGGHTLRQIGRRWSATGDSAWLTGCRAWRAACRQLGLPMRPHGPGASTLIEIAAIATAPRARLGTRHIAAYEGCAVKILSPWNA